MKKYLLLLLFAITVLFVLSGCGNKREIDDDTVVSYLEESYFAERGLSIDELSDITESEAESVQKRNLTCTTKASGELCSQTANWTITFEKLSDEWVGIENEMGASDLILNEPSESYILGLVGTIAQDKINYWYYHLENFSVDTDSSEMELTVRVYINHKYYVEAIDYLFLYRWNAYSLSWSKVNDGEFMNSFVILKYDISGNYDTKDYGVVTISNSEGEYYVSTSKNGLNNQKLEFRYNSNLLSTPYVYASLWDGVSIRLLATGELRINNETIAKDVLSLPETDWEFSYHY